MSHLDETTAACLKYTAVFSKTAERRAGVRSGLSHGAALCDAMIRDIRIEHSKKRGGLTKEGERLVALAQRCGDAIWAMRSKVGASDG